MLGTAAYLSPEQARGDESGPASDIYSLGVCAYQFLTGRLPHEYTSLTELALKQQQEQVAPATDYRPEVPHELDDAIRLALEREPSARYSSALEMAEAMEAGLRGEATAATQAIDQTEATSVLRRTTVGPSPTRVQQAAPRGAAAPRRAPVADRPARRSGSGRRFGSFLALLAAIAAIAIVAIALLSSSGGETVEPVDGGDAQGQIDGLRDFIGEHSR